MFLISKQLIWLDPDNFRAIFNLAYQTPHPQDNFRKVIKLCSNNINNIPPEKISGKEYFENKYFLTLSIITLLELSPNSLSHKDVPEYLQTLLLDLEQHPESSGYQTDLKDMRRLAYTWLPK